MKSLSTLTHFDPRPIPGRGHRVGRLGALPASASAALLAAAAISAPAARAALPANCAFDTRVR
jgi:hypothetical protein